MIIFCGKWKILHLIYFEKICTNYNKYFEEIFTNFEKGKIVQIFDETFE